MRILETLIKESTKKTVAKVLGHVVEEITCDVVNNYKEIPKNQKIQKQYSFVPFSSDDYEHRNYKGVMEELVAYGFTNIVLLPKKDLLKGWIIKDGEIESVVINGKEKFRKNSKFESNVRIVITYHTFKNK